MSLASLGPRKYGRAFDGYSKGGEDEIAKVIVRYIPIVIEGDERDSESKIVNDGIGYVPINYSWSISSFPQSKSTRLSSFADDRSSLSSQSSDNSIETSRRNINGEKVVRAWMTSSEEDRNSLGYNYWDRLKESDGRLGQERGMAETKGLRRPFKDITQVRKQCILI